MGTNIVIKGANFSQNAIEFTADELIAGIFNSNVIHRGLTIQSVQSVGSTNIEGIYYATLYNGDKKICIGNGGISLSELLDLGITKITLTPKNGYRFNVAIGNTTTSVICNGSWAHLTQELTIDFTSFHGTDWTQVENCAFLLCIVQKSTDETENLKLDFTEYMDFSCQ